MTNGLALKIVLAVSLALNLFIVGGFAGAAIQRRHAVALRTAPVPGNPMMRAGDQLPPDQRQAYRMALRQAGLANQPMLETSRQARQKVADAFSAQTFDPQAAESALAASRDAEMAARAKLESVVVDFAKTLPTDQRKVLAEGLRRPPGPGGRGGRFGGGFRSGGGRFGPGGPEGGPPGGPPDDDRGAAPGER